MSSGFYLFAADANGENRNVGWAENQGRNGCGIQCGLPRINPRA